MNLNYALITGNAALELKKLPKESVDLIVTSPPYDDLRAYNGYVFDFKTFRAIARGLFRVLKPGGTLVWIVSDATKDGSESLMSMEQALYFKKTVGFRMHDTMVYYRSGVPLTKRRYEQYWEYMFVLTKGSPKTFNGIRVPKLYPETKPRVKAFGRNRDNSVDFGTILLTDHTKLDSNVWKVSKTSDKMAHDHPAIFPEELAMRHIYSWSNEGDVVLDPFCGSGTTGKMALATGRKFIGIDASAEYIALTKRRLAEARHARVQGLASAQQTISAV